MNYRNERVLIQFFVFRSLFLRSVDICFPQSAIFLWQSHLPRLREQHCYVLDEQTEQHRVLFLNGLVFVAAISRSQLRHWIWKRDRILYIGNISFQGTIVFPTLGIEVSKMQLYWIGNEMNCLRFESERCGSSLGCEDWSRALCLHALAWAQVQQYLLDLEYSRSDRFVSLELELILKVLQTSLHKVLESLHQHALVK